MLHRIAVGMLTFFVVLSMTATGIVLLSTGITSAEVSGDFSYWLIDGGTGVEIYGYYGPGGDVIIPATIEGKPVVSIAEHTFWNCYTLTSVTIQDGVRQIGIQAFQNCMSLTSVVMSSSVTSLGYGVFWGCNSLSTVTLSDGLTSIADYLFAYCSNITSIVIPDSVTSIGSYAFWCCTSMTNVSIASGVTSIGFAAFSECSGLISIVLPEALISIGDAAFDLCTSLISVTIPKNVTGFGVTPFWDCFSLNAINADPENAKFASIDGVLFTKDFSTLVEYPGGKNASVMIPAIVTEIGGGAFGYCTSIISLIIPNRVTSLGDLAFWGCSALTTLTIPASVTSVGNDAFWGCSLLSRITFAGDAPSIGYNWAYGCPENLTVYYHENANGFTTPIWNGVWAYPLSIQMKITSPSDGSLINSTEVTVSWTVHTSSSGIANQSIFVDAQAEIDLPQDAMNFTLTGLSEGNHTVTVEAVDNGMNVSADSIMFTVDTVAPSIVSKAPNGEAVLPASSISVQFSEAMNETSVHFIMNGAIQVGWTSISGNNYSYSLASLAYATDYIICVEGKDLAGNILASPNSWNFTVITQVTGTVNDDSGGPITNARVLLTQGSTTIEGLTDVNGNFALLVNGGTYDLTISKDGFQSYVQNGKTFGVGCINSLGILEITYAVPNPPTWLTAIVGNSQVILNWAAPEFNGGIETDYYVVYRDGFDVAHPATTMETITGLTNGQIYGFTVTAHNIAGNSTPSNVVNISPFTIPDVPILNLAIDDSSQIFLNWSVYGDGGSAITCYNLYRSNSDNGIYAIIASLPGQAYTDTNVTLGQLYWYKVSAVNAAGQSANSSAVSALAPQPVSIAFIAIVIAVGTTIMVGLFVLRRHKVKR